MWKEQVVSILVIINIIVWSSSYLIGEAFCSRIDAVLSTNLTDQVATAAEIADVNHRSLSLSQIFDPIIDPKSLVPRTGFPVPKKTMTMKIYLLPTRHGIGRTPSLSIFKTDILQRYGSGRFDFVVQDVASCGNTCANLENQLVATDQYQTPCLVVTDDNVKCPSLQIRCNYPLCKTMRIGDEYCKDRRFFDVRSYYSSGLKVPGYLPLGPRLDAWTSLQQHGRNPDFSIKSASKRRYAFNAIFSKDTNQGRSQLAGIIEKENGMSNMTNFIHVAEKWNRDPNDPRTEQLNTDKYTEVLLDSVFTLSPAGHNPECYRLFETVEAGSIPVMVKDDLHVTHKGMHNCIDALVRWYSAPMVVLDSWDHLFATLTLMMDDVEWVNKLQAELRLWYNDEMQQNIWEFEDVVMEPKIE